MYNNKILEIFKNPTNAGGLQGSNGIGKYVNPECGDFVKIYLRIDNNIIQEARFKTMGSVGSIVASSVLCKLVTELSVKDALLINVNSIIQETGEYPSDKVYTISFALNALKLAIQDYAQRVESEGKPKKRGRKPLSEKAEDKYEQFINGLKNVDEPDEKDSLEEENEDGYENYLQDIDSLDKVLTNDSAPVEQKGAEQEETVDYYDEFDDDFLFTEYAEAQMDIQREKERRLNERAEFENEIKEQNQIAASKRVEESKNYVPIIETKIISDEDVLKLEKENLEQKNQKTKRAKEIFDSMFED